MMQKYNIFFNRPLRKIDFGKKSYLSFMFYKDIEKLSGTHFMRLTGVKREVFEQMLGVLSQAKAGLRKHPIRRTSSKLHKF